MILSELQIDLRISPQEIRTILFVASGIGIYEMNPFFSKEVKVLKNEEVLGVPTVDFFLLFKIIEKFGVPSIGGNWNGNFFLPEYRNHGLIEGTLSVSQEVQETHFSSNACRRVSFRLFSLFLTP